MKRMIRTDWAVVLGGADCVRDDFGALSMRFPGGRWPGLVIAVNDLIVHWEGRVDHAVSLHPEKLAQWKAERDAKGLPGKAVTWGRTPRYCARTVADWPGVSSGGLGIQVAVEKLGAYRVVLCGVPMTATPHFAESTEFHIVDMEGNWAARQADHHFEALAKLEPQLRGLVKSMSGRTKDLFGAPVLEWFESAPEPTMTYDPDAGEDANG